MKYPNLTALLDITLNENLLLVEKNGGSYNNLTKTFKFTTVQNLQEKIRKFLDNSDFVIVKQSYDNTEESNLSKTDFYNFVEEINENKDVNLIDTKDFSIKLTFMN